MNLAEWTYFSVLDGCYRRPLDPGPDDREHQDSVQAALARRG